MADKLCSWSVCWSLKDCPLPVLVLFTLSFLQPKFSGRRGQGREKKAEVACLEYRLYQVWGQVTTLLIALEFIPQMFFGQKWPCIPQWVTQEVGTRCIAPSDLRATISTTAVQGGRTSGPGPPCIPDWLIQLRFLGGIDFTKSSNKKGRYILASFKNYN